MTVNRSDFQRRFKAEPDSGDRFIGMDTDDGSGDPFITDLAGMAAGLAPIIATDASAISVLDTAGNYTSTDVEGALAEISFKAPVGALYLPGASGNYVSTPDSAATSPATQLDLRVRCALVDWSNGSAQALIAKQTSGQLCYTWSMTSAGGMQLLLSTDGSNWTFPAGVTPPLVDGTCYWLRATWRSSDGRLQQFYAPDSPTEPTSWTQVGSDVTGPTSSLFDSTSATTVGAAGSGGTSNYATGNYLRAVVRTTIDGTIVADWRGGELTASPYRDTAGNTWTVNGSSWGWTLGKA